MAHGEVVPIPTRLAALGKIARAWVVEVANLSVLALVQFTPVEVTSPEALVWRHPMPEAR